MDVHHSIVFIFNGLLDHCYPYQDTRLCFSASGGAIYRLTCYFIILKLFINDIFQPISAVLLSQFEMLSTGCEMTLRRLTPTYWIKKCSLVTSSGCILYILYCSVQVAYPNKYLANRCTDKIIKIKVLIRKRTFC